MQLHILSWRRFYAGSIFVLIGLAGVYFASSLYFGTPDEMGPGFVPVVCAWLIVALGGVVLTQAFYGDVEVLQPIMPRPVFMIFLAVGLFALLIDRAGLGISVFITAFVASYAGQARFFETLALSIGASVAAIVIFIVLLGLPMRIWPELG